MSQCSDSDGVRGPAANALPIDPDVAQTVVESPRWAAKIVPDDESDCLLWTGWEYGDGYGGVKIGAKSYLAHRVLYVAHHGRDVEPGAVVHHVCLNRRCVNPEHLRETDIRDAVLAPGSKSATAPCAAATVCPQGHPYDGDNLYLIPATRGRVCRICKAEQHAEQAERFRVAQVVSGLGALDLKALCGNRQAELRAMFEARAAVLTAHGIDLDRLLAMPTREAIAEVREAGLAVHPLLASEEGATS